MADFTGGAETIRLAFLTSCLEPARDGVGDYTRLLAKECQRQGQICCLLALNDPFVQDVLEIGSDDLLALRLPDRMGWAERMTRAKSFCEKFQPNWLSLQFVPYGFHRKGIVWSLPGSLGPLVAGHRLHLMLHELWIGAGRSASWKHRVVGALQRWSIQSMLRLIGPLRVSTSNLHYAQMLACAHIDAAILPLFGNIPIADASLEKTTVATLDAAGIHLPDVARREWLIGTFFGILHPEWRPEALLEIVVNAAKRTGRRAAILAAGRMGKAGDAIWAQMQRTYGKNITFLRFGEQSSETVSALLQFADFGIAASPWELIGKSGSATAMLEHGLPVIVTRHQAADLMSSTNARTADVLLYRCDSTLEDKLVAGLPKRKPGSWLAKTAEEFLRQLTS